MYRIMLYAGGSPMPVHPCQYRPFIHANTDRSLMPIQTVHSCLYRQFTHACTDLSSMTTLAAHPIPAHTLHACLQASQQRERVAALTSRVGRLQAALKVHKHAAQQALEGLGASLKARLVDCLVWHSVVLRGMLHFQHNRHGSHR